MSLPAYPEHKQSGIEWIGNIPKHWNVKKLKFLLARALQYGANESAELDDPQLPRYVRITDIDETGNLRDDTFRSLPKEVALPYLLEEGDLLFARSGATSGKTFLYRKSWGICAYAGYLIRARLEKANVFPQYVKYFTVTSIYWQWLSSVYIQATIQNVSAEKYGDLWITLPPLPEQRAIADFLNAKTAKLDTLVEKRRELIEKLKEKRSALISRTVTRGLPPEAARAAGMNPNPKLKPSGIEWLGEIPEHWEIKKIRYLGLLKSGENITSDELEVDGEFPVFGGNGIRGYSSRFTHHGHYVLIGRQGALCGNVNYATSKFWASEHAIVVSPVTEFATVWLGELLRSMNLNQYSISAAQPGLSVDMINKLQIPVPSFPEQRAIADYLDLETNKIDRMVAKVEEAIECLQEYRTALITAAVTGKIDVRNVHHSGENRNPGDTDAYRPSPV